MSVVGSQVRSGAKATKARKVEGNRTLQSLFPLLPTKIWVWSTIAAAAPCATRQSPLATTSKGLQKNRMMLYATSYMKWQPAIILEIKVHPQRFPNLYIPGLQKSWSDIVFQPATFYRGNRPVAYRLPNDENVASFDPRLHEYSAPGYVGPHADQLWREYLKKEKTALEGVNESLPLGPWDALYYVHFKGRNRRHDGWRRLDQILPIELDIRSSESLALSLLTLAKSLNYYSSQGTWMSNYTSWLKTIISIRKVQDASESVYEPFYCLASRKKGRDNVRKKMDSLTHLKPEDIEALMTVELNLDSGKSNYPGVRPNTPESIAPKVQGICNAGRPWLFWKLCPDATVNLPAPIPPWGFSAGSHSVLGVSYPIQLCILGSLCMLSFAYRSELDAKVQSLSVYRLVEKTDMIGVVGYKFKDILGSAPSYCKKTNESIVQDFMNSQINIALKSRVECLKLMLEHPIDRFPFMEHEGLLQGPNVLESPKSDGVKNSAWYQAEIRTANTDEYMMAHSVGESRRPAILQTNEFTDSIPSISGLNPNNYNAASRMTYGQQLPLMQSFEPGLQGDLSWKNRLIEYSGPLKYLTSQELLVHFSEEGILGHTDIDEYEVMEQGSQVYHEQSTLLRTIDSISYGGEVIDTWYFSPYPREVHGIDCLFICTYCLRFFAFNLEFERHMDVCCTKNPPGNEVFRRRDMAVYEVDGSMAKGYCQNLCWLAKLFLDHKTLQYDVDPFLFYVLVRIEEDKCSTLGFFSKEKQSTMGFNLACIMTLPKSQRQGVGKVLQSVSFIISRIEGRLGSPEKPISDLGRRSYSSYWAEALLRPLKYVINSWHLEEQNEQKYVNNDEKTLRLNIIGNVTSRSAPNDILWSLVRRKYAHIDRNTRPKESQALSISINDFGIATGISHQDACFTLLEFGFLRKIRGKWVIWAPPMLLEKALSMTGRPCKLLSGKDFMFVPWESKNEKEGPHTPFVQPAVIETVQKKSKIDQGRLSRIKQRAIEIYKSMKISEK